MKTFFLKALKASTSTKAMKALLVPKSTAAIKILFPVLLFGVFVSCSQNPDYFNYQSFQSDEWPRDSSKVFEFTNSDTISLNAVHLHLRHGFQYPYRNIWLKISMISPSGVKLTEKYQFVLTDKQNNWKGRGVAAYVDYQSLLKKNLSFKEKGNYKFEIMHDMSDSILKNMDKVGISISKLKNGKE